MTSTLSTQNLSIGFASSIVAEAVDISVSTGEILVITGPNGVGKSTLGKTMVRLIKPLKGEIQIDGQNVEALSSREFAQKVAYVSQIQDAASSLTVEEMVTLGRSPHQRWWQWQGSIDDKKVVEDVIASTSLNELKSRPVDSLSGGERQRVYVAMALAQQPAFLILDEPTAFLDFKHQLELVDLLKKLSVHNIGIVAVLHDLNLTKRIASKVLLMQKNENAPGTVKALGASNVVLTASNLKDVFNVAIGSVTDAASGREFIFFDSL